MVEAYRSVFPSAAIEIWSRNSAHARQLAGRMECAVANDLASAAGDADVICTATMATEPVVHGAWLRPGQHLDLIGGYRPDMREVDDEAIRRATVFADCLQTALDVGDIADPIRSGLLTADDIADFRELGGRFARSSPDEITICKNAGGAHLDLMVARHMFETVGRGAAS